MGTYNTLTHEEEQFIKQHKDELTIGEIALALGRSYFTIQKAIKTLGEERIHRWTEKEDMILLSQYGNVPACEIAEQIGVNVDSVYNRIRKLRGTK